MTDLVLLDLDGTLVDSPGVILDTFAEVFTSLGVPVPDRAAIRATIGIPIGDAFALLLPVGADDRLVAEAVARYKATFQRIALPRARELVFPGVVDGLAELRRDGLTLAVATSKMQVNADAVLKAAGLRESFAMVVGADRVSRPKPDPETAFLILRELDVAPERAVMVGDTTHDVLMARAAGIDSIAVTYGIHGLPELKAAGPTWIADAFEEVVAFVRARP